VVLDRTGILPNSCSALKPRAAEVVGVVPSVTVEVFDDGVCLIKFAAPDWELNVSVPASEVAVLRRVPSSPWLPGAVRAGVSAGSPAFWSAEADGRVSVLVGHDDQTWDFGVSFPMAALDEVLRAVEAAGRGCPGAEPGAAADGGSTTAFPGS
jgi:hypothetical protein